MGVTMAKQPAMDPLLVRAPVRERGRPTATVGLASMRCNGAIALPREESNELAGTEKGGGTESPRSVERGSSVSRRRSRTHDRHGLKRIEGCFGVAL